MSKILNPHHGPFRISHYPKLTWAIFTGISCLWSYSHKYADAGHYMHASQKRIHELPKAPVKGQSSIPSASLHLIAPKSLNILFVTSLTTDYIYGFIVLFKYNKHQ